MASPNCSLIYKIVPIPQNMFIVCIVLNLSFEWFKFVYLFLGELIPNNFFFFFTYIDYYEVFYLFLNLARDLIGIIFRVKS